MKSGETLAKIKTAAVLIAGGLAQLAEGVRSGEHGPITQGERNLRSGIEQALELLMPEEDIL